jgi:hypothetical protein
VAGGAGVALGAAPVAAGRRRGAHALAARVVGPARRPRPDDEPVGQLQRRGRCDRDPRHVPVRLPVLVGAGALRAAARQPDRDQRGARGPRTRALCARVAPGARGRGARRRAARRARGAVSRGDGRCVGAELRPRAAAARGGARAPRRPSRCSSSSSRSSRPPATRAARARSTPRPCPTSSAHRASLASRADARRDTTRST